MVTSRVIGGVAAGRLIALSRIADIVAPRSGHDDSAAISGRHVSPQRFQHYQDRRRQRRRGADHAAAAACRSPAGLALPVAAAGRSEEHTSELQSLMRISYAVFCLKKKNIQV